jgi:hypothetical protein
MCLCLMMHTMVNQLSQTYIVDTDLGTRRIRQTWLCYDRPYDISRTRTRTLFGESSVCVSGSQE